MPDRLDKLRTTLAELEAELRELDSIDDATRDVLADAAAEISATLRRGKRSPETKRAETSLKGQLADFEASHPQLAGILTRLIDGLGQLGI
jgi:phytoene/squalene synthetase